MRPSGLCPGVITGSRFGASRMELWPCFIPAGRWWGSLSAGQRHGWDGARAG
jgi:hypothetical protein